MHHTAQTAPAGTAAFDVPTSPILASTAHHSSNSVHKSQAPRHMMQVTRHMSHATRHTCIILLKLSSIMSLCFWVLTCIVHHMASHTLHVTRHTSHVTRHTSHCHTLLVTRHTSKITRHHETLVTGNISYAASHKRRNTTCSTSSPQVFICSSFFTCSARVMHLTPEQCCRQVET